MCVRYHHNIARIEVVEDDLATILKIKTTSLYV